MISYESFGQTLRQSGESTYSLIKNHRVSSSTIDKLRKTSPSTPPRSTICAAF